MADILVVEDEGIIAEDIRITLERIGHHVVALCATGEEAVAQVDQRPPDLVLMDIHLAGDMDGIEAARTIQSRHDLPIIYLTAYADSDTLSRAKATGPFAYLVKPFDETSLKPAIELTLDRHVLDQKKARFAELLEERVQERTLDLEKQKRVLERSYQAMNTFVQMVGHDLKEPVRNIDSLLTVVRQDHTSSLPRPVQDLVAKTQAANRKLSTLVAGIFAFSRLAASDIIQRQAVGIAETLEDPECRVRFEDVLKERAARVELPDPDHKGVASPMVLGQVLGELVLNAIQHNPNDPVVQVTSRLDETAREIEVTIKDNGPGLPADVLAWFDQAVSTPRQGRFGLAIAKLGVTCLDGRMWIEGRGGEGSAIHIRLPAATAGPDPKTQK